MSLDLNEFWALCTDTVSTTNPGAWLGTLGALRMRKNEAHSCDLTHHQNGSEGNASEPYKSHVPDQHM